MCILGVKGRSVGLSRADKRVDWLGIFLFTAGFVLLFASLSQARAARNGWATDCKLFEDDLSSTNAYIDTLLLRIISDIIAMFTLSFVTIGCALGWQSYLEERTNFPPIIRPSLMTRRKGKLTLVCLVIVRNVVVDLMPGVLQ
jgi:hypothetical protein